MYATPEAVAEAADSLVQLWRTPTGTHHGEVEWDGAQAVRIAIDTYRRHTVGLLAASAGFCSRWCLSASQAARASAGSSSRQKRWITIRAGASMYLMPQRARCAREARGAEVRNRWELPIGPARGKLRPLIVCPHQREDR
ncbi:hypothetical protein GCM10023080_087380 [Streptomyces pseudoechinosporeus]